MTFLVRLRTGYAGLDARVLQACTLPDRSRRLIVQDALAPFLSKPKG